MEKLIEREYTDSENRLYKHIILPGIKKAVLTNKGMNKEFEGEVKIVIREGESKFGEEVLIEFRILEELKEYSTATKHNCFESYIKKEEAIELFDQILKKLKKEDKTI